ncbi:hypothetical protein DMUE_5316 [Dictyocoela muelleri]|nr:hypothetical protein DMUE_5316 [Dictyocoela muelleri]
MFNTFSIENDSLNNEQSIMDYHKKMNHRMRIKKGLAKIGILTSLRSIRNIIKKCETCQKIDRKIISPGEFIYTYHSRQKVAFDIMEIKKNDLVILGIDYFTRKIFGKAIKTKESKNIIFHKRDTRNISDKNFIN